MDTSNVYGSTIITIFDVLDYIGNTRQGIKNTLKSNGYDNNTRNLFKSDLAKLKSYSYIVKNMDGTKDIKDFDKIVDTKNKIIHTENLKI